MYRGCSKSMPKSTYALEKHSGKENNTAQDFNVLLRAGINYRVSLRQSIK